MLKSSPQTIRPIDYLPLLSTFKRPITLDVRDIDYNCDGGTVANSIHVPFTKVVANTDGIKHLHRADACFIYCRTSAARALLSANRISKAYPNLPTYIIGGGIIGLQREAPAVQIVDSSAPSILSSL
ncbi:hypothetical protein QR46_4286 [Giardia duodenalis assemblage B]|uniref:Rhodanese domain-containing protein n=1 Tax=Giardia duodenalis assemblage B TaxID=1394984 RepID=A0A132NP17_GIAIN|nr:hypothetical protein QR46_4286 [Giardia intestinalis assemblage B]